MRRPYNMPRASGAQRGGAPVLDTIYSPPLQDPAMPIPRRTFLGQSARLAGGGLSLAALGPETGGAQPPAATGGLPPTIRALRPMTAGVVPIADDERRARIEKARRLMAEHRLDAILLEGGSSMFY